jgi:uncharacterized protein (TIGR02145 family)
MKKSYKIWLLTGLAFTTLLFIFSKINTPYNFESSEEAYSKGLVFLNKNLTANAADVDTIDGYPVINVDGTVWMIENLNSTCYCNGDAIPEVRDEEAWLDLNEGAWCFYNNDPKMGEKYGKIYNWFTVGDSRGICPCSWRVPSDQEWIYLVNHFGGKYASVYFLNSDLGWAEENNFRNNSGFSALPGGYRPTSRESQNGVDDFAGLSGAVWWSATEGRVLFDKYIRNKTAWGIDFNTGYAFRANNPWYVGQYVRCVKV